MKIADMMVDYLCNEETKEEILKALNEAVDIPMINEKTEAKILDAIYSVVETAIKVAIRK
tara:strand:- start:18 stop:197 length:180 start_codon:yes stop_codon:yes gene_type:complete